MRTAADSPFNWRMRTEPSIFAKDLYFRARSDGKTEASAEKLLAYKQFGVYSKAATPKKQNKHEK